MSLTNATAVSIIRNLNVTVNRTASTNWLDYANFKNGNTNYTVHLEFLQVSVDPQYHALATGYRA
jgi:hypothetical protein